MPAPTEKFAPVSACPKCGNGDPERTTASYVAANQVEGKDYEYLDVTCNRCGYHREQLPFDA
jgi:predicted nucleic-acid-binding Zn-ribbon protein